MIKQHQKNKLSKTNQPKLQPNFNKAYHSFSDLFSRHFINTFNVEDAVVLKFFWGTMSEKMKLR